MGRGADTLTAGPDLAESLARHTAAIDPDEIDHADLERLRHCVLDWLGATIAGAESPAARAVRATVDRHENGAATIVGTSLRCAARDAALANGAAAHALELDDVSRSMRGHPSASVCSATLALAEARRADGADVAAGLFAGYDVASRLGGALGPGHAAAGWHATGTIGTFASAASCSRLLRLDAGATCRALGLAATQAAGLNASVGTTGKALHTGKAAADGILAALLAERGATAPEHAIEHFASATTATFEPQRASPEPGLRSIVYKRHACCGLAQESIDAIVELRASHGFSAGDVRAVALEVGPTALAICRYAEPHDEIEARFSLPFSAALALAGRDTGPAGYGAESVRDPELIRLCARVGATLRDGEATHVTVELFDGRRVQTSVSPELPARDAELPDQWVRLVGKFERLVRPILGDARTEEALAAVGGPALDGLVAATRAAVSG
jgi:2-methylcitrate dehydratase PrpD